MSSAIEKGTATLDDLYRVEGKAELIGGEIVHQMASGHRPNVVAGRIFRRLADFVDDLGRGVAYTENMGFAVGELQSGRQSFSPDAAYYLGPLPTNDMRFVEGPPTFAVEVRSENDYGPAADRAIAAKRIDYFEAGTEMVWEVDSKDRCIHSYIAREPDRPRIFRLGQTADAEPAVPGWRIAVDWIFA